MKPVAIGLATVGGAALALSDVGGSPVVIARLAITGVTLGAATATDLAEHRIPNRLVLPAAAACAALTLASGLNAATVVGLGVIMLLLVIGLAVPSAVGMGDIKLMFVVVLGLQGNALHALFLTLVLAGTAAGAAMVGKGRAARRKSLPLAPFLALGSLLALV
jgi:leader peptidase (prepilin peptidase)/N-methyltransferase